ncbi:MAG: glutamine amidotransferase family protein [Chloroflexota bacterium]
MRNLRQLNNPYGEDKVIAACSIFGAMDTSGRRFAGKDVIRAIANMHVRGNGLGGGLTAYGIYPDYAEFYAFHVMFDSCKGKEATEAFLNSSFKVMKSEEVPTQPHPAITSPPLVWRYFVEVNPDQCASVSADDYVVSAVMKINTGIEDSFVFSSGKNMGVFKGVGYPEEIAHYFCLEDAYKGYCWTAHGRFPTNSRGWWGGAHPFSILDWTVVHNGEISSYGINRRYLEQFGYQCTLETDTEVVAYAVDLLMRRHNLPLEIMAKVLAPPLWEQIERMPAEEREFVRALRQVYGSLVLNGPFAVVIAHEGEIIGLTDRIRLRPLTVGEKGDMVYLSSEESAIRLISPELDRAWSPMGGEPVVARIKPGRRASRNRSSELVKA